MVYFHRPLKSDVVFWQLRVSLEKDGIFGTG